MKRALPFLFLLFLTYTCACKAPPIEENHADTEANSAEPDTSIDKEADQDVVDQGTAQEDIPHQEDAPGQEDIPAEPDPPVTELCGELIIQATLGQEHIQDNGNYTIANLTPQNNLFTDQCPVSDPSVTRGQESIVRFIAPRDGIFTFQSSRGVSQLALLSSCEATQEPLACSYQVSHHSTAFSEPRTLLHNMQQGEEVLIVMDSVTGFDMGLTVHTPFVEGQHCVVNTNSAIQRACASDLWCDWSAQEEQDRVCRAPLTPQVTQLLVTVGDQTLHMKIEGVYHGTRAIQNIEVTMRDAEGNVLAPGPGLGSLSTSRVHQWSTSRDHFNLHTSFVIPADLSARISTITAELISHTGGRSDPFTQTITPRAEAAPGQACDHHRVQQVCSPGTFCSPTTTEGDFQCIAPMLSAWHDEGELFVGAQLPALGPDAPYPTLFVFENGDLAKPAHTIRYNRSFKDLRLWTLKGRFSTPAARTYHIAFGHPDGAWDTPTPLPLSTPTPMAEDSRCDGDRITDRCLEGMACKPIHDQDSFTCQSLHAPTIEGVTWYQGEDRGIGAVVQATDFNRDITTLLVDTVLDGEVQGTFTFNLQNASPEQATSDGDSLEIRWSRPWSSPGLHYQARLIDLEGLTSETTLATLPTHTTQESTQGQTCDRHGVLQTCAEGLVCDWVPGDPNGFSCHTLDASCPEDWPAQTLTHERGARNITVEGDLSQGQDLGPGCYGSDEPLDTLYHFVSQEEGYYRFEVVTREFQNPSLTLRSHCALPRLQEPVCASEGTDRHIGYSVIETWLEADEEIYLLLGSDRLETTPYTLTVSW